MRKSSKILAVLLTVCLLCGVLVAIVASAGNENPLNITSHSLNYSNDYSTASTAGIVHTSNGYTVGIKPTYDADGKYLKFVHDATYDKSTTDQIFHATYEELVAGKWIDRKDGAALTTGTQGMGHMILAFPNQGMADPLKPDKIKETGIVYMVQEFDYGIDSYRYSYVDGNGVTIYAYTLEDLTAKHTADTTFKTEEAKAAAIANAAGTEELAAFDTLGFNYEGLNHQIYIYKLGEGKNAKYYVHNAKTIGTADIMYELSNKVGEFDRFSFVLKFTVNIFTLLVQRLWRQMLHITRSDVFI